MVTVNMNNTVDRNNIMLIEPSIGTTMSGYHKREGSKESSASAGRQGSKQKRRIEENE